MVTIFEAADYTELRAEGRIDASTVGEFELKTLEVAEQSTVPIFVNFSKVEYISSAGLRAILKLAKTCQKKKLKLGCFAMAKGVLEVFRISGFASIISISDTLDQAKAKALGNAGLRSAAPHSASSHGSSFHSASQISSTSHGASPLNASAFGVASLSASLRNASPSGSGNSASTANNAGAYNAGVSNAGFSNAGLSGLSSAHPSPAGTNTTRANLTNANTASTGNASTQGFFATQQINRGVSQ